MKKIIATILILFIGTLCNAQERLNVSLEPNSSYLLLLENPATSIITTNDSVANAEILATIFNERNQVILSTLNVGEAKIFIDFGSELAIIEVNVEAGNVFAELPSAKMIQAMLRIDKPFGSDKLGNNPQIKEGAVK